MGCGTSVHSIKVKDRARDEIDGGSRESSTPELPAGAVPGRQEISALRGGGGGRLARAKSLGYAKMPDGSPNPRLTPRTDSSAAADDRGQPEGTTLDRSRMGSGSWNFSGTGKWDLATRGGRAIRSAAARGDAQTIRAIAAAGQDVNEPTRNGVTALVYAVENNWLVSVGGSLAPNSCRRGWRQTRGRAGGCWLLCCSGGCC